MNSQNQKRFSSHLMKAVVILVTGSVLLISGMLYIYFGKKLESEFNKKMLAQKGQIEIILKNRITEVKNRLGDLSSDNTIRVTMMMGKPSQLNKVLKQSYPARASLYFFAKKRDQLLIYPETHPGISNKILDKILAKPMNGEIIEEGAKTGLIWSLDAPVMNRTERMGTVYALYDMAHDRELIETIRRNVKGDFAIIKPDSLMSLTSDTSLPFNTEKLGNQSHGSELLHLSPHLVLSRLDGFKNLCFISSRENLLKEKKKISIFIGVFSVLVLSLSATLSLFMGRQMGRPLNEMAAKAIQISEGNKDILFDNSAGSYWEFNKLSQAFNHMLTNLKDAEEKSRYRELLENVDDAVYLIDRQGKILEANEATYLQLGYSPERFFHMDISAILPEEDVRMFLGKLNSNTKDHNQGKKTLETSHMLSDGNSIPVEINYRPITYRGEKVILNVARDIRKRKEAEKALRESEERYRSVVENSHDGILILDETLRMIYTNDELCRILGHSRRDIEDRYFKEFLTEESASFMEDMYLPGSNGEEAQSQFELEIIRKDREKRHGKISATTIEDSEGKQRTLVHILDMTDQFLAEQEKKRLEAQLRHAQKMEAVGTLAGGIAHDFNNLLLVIQGYSDLLLLKNKKAESGNKELQQIKDATQRASELTQQLLTFSRKVESKLRPIHMNNEIKQVNKLFKRTIPKMIETQLNLADNLRMINGDPAQLGQVLMNLGVNARDAMPDGGKLVIETDNITLDKEYFKTHLGATPGDYVCIIISDTGQGMDKETLDHIFEPFYTTKDVGKGTGLGLAIVYGIVKNHKGYITCYSEPGMGTTFKIYFPSIDGKLRLEEKKSEDALTGGTETILLVDDDKHILNLGLEMLSNFGYTVFTAPDGESALEFYKDKQGEIDLIIVDLIMPGMGGKKFLEELLKRNPKAKVIMSSGHAPNGPVKTAITAGAKSFIGKPYETHQILHEVRRVLDET